MPLFGKKNREPEVRTMVGFGAPVVVQDGDLERVSELMQLFNRGVGSDAGMRSFGVAFNRAGGFISDMNALDAVRDVGPDATKRPWFWLFAVEREAMAQGNVLLIAQIALMSQYWSTQIAPLLTTADWFDGIVDSPSESALAQIHTLALQAVPGLTSDTVVLKNATGAINAGQVLFSSAQEVLKVEGLVDPSMAAAARQLLGQ